MKEYEKISDLRIVSNSYICARLDGKAFHTFARGLKKPFDEILVKSMQETAKYLCENIQGAIIGYTQSDEISIIFTDISDNSKDTSPMFSNRVQKFCSIFASMATMIFNRVFRELSKDTGEEYSRKFDKAMFDCRIFQIPKQEITSYIWWRQKDCIKNSITMVAQSVFSHKQLHGINSMKKKELLAKKGVIYGSDYATHLRRGTAFYKEYVEVKTDKGSAMRGKWFVDLDMPAILDDRGYIDNKINITFK